MSSKDPFFRVIRLTASNVRKIVALDITPPAKGSYVVGGKNGQGKTSVLDCVMIAFCEADAENVKAIRQGAEQAVVTVETEQFSATRTIHESGRQTLVVKAREGHTIKRPREFLDGLIGNLSFDPLEFSRLSGKDQRAMLMSLTGLTVVLTDIDQQRSIIYDARKLVNQSLRDAKGTLRDLPAPDAAAPTEMVNVQPLLEEKNRQQRAIDDNAANRRSAEAEETAVNALLAKRKALFDEIKRLDAELIERGGKLRERRDELSNLIDPIISQIDDQIIEAQDTNQAFTAARSQNEAVATAKEKVTDLTADSTAKTAAIDKLEYDKSRILAAAEFPIEGLSFDGEDVLLNGIPFTQLSGAETLRVSLAMGMALNPKLRYIRITDGSLLDEDAKRFVHEQAMEKDYQVFIECVGEPDDAAIIIEDGAVVQ